jgi:hypothetical protein
MNDIANPPLALTPDDDPMASVGRLWPSPEYSRQVEQLRAPVGATIYLVELEATQVQLGIHVNDQPYTLLGLVDFPRPDPIKGLAPHLWSCSTTGAVSTSGGSPASPPAGPSARPRPTSCFRTKWRCRPSCSASGSYRRSSLLNEQSSCWARSSGNL